MPIVEGEVAGERVEEGLHRGAAERAVLVGATSMSSSSSCSTRVTKSGRSRARARAQPREDAAGVAQAFEPDLAEVVESAVCPSRRRRDEVEGVDDRAALALGDATRSALRDVVGVAPAARSRGRAATTRAG